ncbi:MAG: STAS domain-containing protein [Anaerolineales bacterium]|nr:STAS domain-containing protein [Anaerolineales bacterium]MBX3038649.1 STAS domain-containing protein [Anaerolineales bacterium]
MLEITSTTQNARVPVTIINVKGDIDASNYQEFQSQSEQLVTDGARYLLLNLKEVAYMSSAGLRVIHNLFNQLRTLHKDANDDELRKKMSAGEYKSPFIKVVNLSERVKEAFELGGFETYIEAYNDVEKAVNSF